MPAENVKPFLPSNRSGPVFMGLNILRFLSIVALLLVFSSNIVTMVESVLPRVDHALVLMQCSDIKAIRADHQSPEDWDCDYYEYSTVPDQAGGPFWSILNRLFISEYHQSVDRRHGSHAQSLSASCSCSPKLACRGSSSRSSSQSSDPPTARGA